MEQNPGQPSPATGAERGVRPPRLEPFVRSESPLASFDQRVDLDGYESTGLGVPSGALDLDGGESTELRAPSGALDLDGGQPTERGGPSGAVDPTPVMDEPPGPSVPPLNPAAPVPTLERRGADAPAAVHHPPGLERPGHLAPSAVNPVAVEQVGFAEVARDALGAPPNNRRVSAEAVPRLDARPRVDEASTSPAAIDRPSIAPALGPSLVEAPTPLSAPAAEVAPTLEPARPPPVTSALTAPPPLASGADEASPPPVTIERVVVEKEVVREETPKAPSPPRPMTAAAASVIGPLSSSLRSHHRFSLRFR